MKSYPTMDDDDFMSVCPKMRKKESVQGTYGVTQNGKGEPQKKKLTIAYLVRLKKKKTCN